MPGPQPPSQVAIHSQSVTLTDAEIKALPSVPIVVVPATQVLNYSGLPTELPLPLAFIVSLSNTVGYGNVDGAASYVLAMGSDWSLDAMQSDANLMAPPQDSVRIIGIANSYHSTLVSGMIVPFRVLAGGIQDNALAIVLNNGIAGDLTGGNPANSMTVTVLYTIIDV